MLTLEIMLQQPRRARGRYHGGLEAGSDADEEKNVDEVEAVEAKAPTPEPSAPPRPSARPAQENTRAR